MRRSNLPTGSALLLAASIWSGSVVAEPGLDEQQLASLRAAMPKDRLLLIDDQLRTAPPAATEAQLRRLRAEALRELGRLAEAAEDADRLLALADGLGDALEAARASMLKGTLEAESGNIGAALERFHAALREFEALGAEADQANALNAIGVSHNFVHDYPRARRYYEEALELARRSQASALEQRLLGNLAVVVSVLDGAAAGLELHRQALAHAQQRQDLPNIALQHANLCQRTLELDLEQEAELHCGQALQQLEALGLARPLSGVRMALGQAALSADRHAEALAEFEHALEWARGTVPSVELELYRLLSETQEALDNPSAALDWLRQHVALGAELAERERQAIVEELDARYRVEQSERQVELLSLEGALQQATLRQRNLLLMLLAAGLLLCTVVALLAWRGYRIERKHELALSARNQELESALARIAELARTDPLTGLANRRAFEEQVALEIAKSRRSGSELTLVIADIDNFKPLNDRFGHAAGDEVLRQLAQRLKGGLREGDLLCRWGGEEFLCLLVDSSVEEAVRVLERLRLSLAQQPIQFDDTRTVVSLTFGVAPLDGDLSAALAAADAALYEGKRGGRDRIVVTAA
jgi:diguanylate cyclase (GGDEF)-like protein